VSGPTRARYPDDQGWVVDEQGVHVFYEVYGDSPDTVRRVSGRVATKP